MGRMELMELGRCGKRVSITKQDEDWYVIRVHKTLELVGLRERKRGEFEHSIGYDSHTSMIKRELVAIDSWPGAFKDVESYSSKSRNADGIGVVPCFS